jgi:hypothetical protein
MYLSVITHEQIGESNTISVSDMNAAAAHEDIVSGLAYSGVLNRESAYLLIYS